jgi:hypothetical protein
MIRPITNAEEAVRFICELYLDDNMFHFETPAEDCVRVIRKWARPFFIETEPSFTPTQAMHLNRRRFELFEHLKDPFKLALCLLEESRVLNK